MRAFEPKINPAAAAFFDTLSPADYPHQLIAIYPRIANRIFALRTHKEALRSYFETLLTDTRGGRRGFPFPIDVEIQDLFTLLIGSPHNVAFTADLFIEAAPKRLRQN